MAVKIWLLIITMLITQCWTIYLPERHEQVEKEILTIEPPYQKQQQQHQLTDQHKTNYKLYSHFTQNTTATTTSTSASSTGLRKQQQKSYDKNVDVATAAFVGGLPTTSLTTDVIISNTTSPDVSLLRRRTKRAPPIDDWLIAPNTRWCGRGNTANGTYNHLGGASSADKCCRKHDHCKLYIPAMSSRFELFNYRPYTLSHCSCDRRFRTCLKMANDEAAFTIGKFFFNVVQTHCFVLTTEKLCQQRASDGSCSREYVKKRAHLKTNRKF